MKINWTEVASAAAILVVIAAACQISNETGWNVRGVLILLILGGVWLYDKVRK